jgi:methylenetetrahydrofolate dehydrogenase (NADP+) / methenyltetrahydrofolate cyclohydrolase
MSTIIDGTAVAQRVLDETRQRVSEITARGGAAPCLATVLVGDDPASVTYTRMKRNRCEAVGMRSLRVELTAASSTADVVGRIAALGQDAAVHGILLQHPVPHHVDERAAFEAIPAAKDVDGLTLASFGGVSFGLPATGYGSCTPAGIMRLLDAYRVDISGKRAVVIGRSPILGKPMAMMLLARDATVTICHSRTRELAEIAASADILVAAVGKPRFVPGAWVKPGAVVIDAGYNPGNVGDVDYEGAAERASLITPVPGGVGPMTVAMLVEHTAAAAARQLGLETL